MFEPETPAENVEKQHKKDGDENKKKGKGSKGPYKKNLPFKISFFVAKWILDALL